MLEIKIINVAENGQTASTKVDLGKENKNFQKLGGGSKIYHGLF